MSWRAFRIAAVATVFGFPILALTMAPTSGQQSTTPRPLDATGPIAYFIADGSGRNGYQATDRELALWAFKAWQRSAGKNLRFEAAPESSALVRLYWSQASDSQYGEMKPLTVSGRRGAAVFIQPELESLDKDIARRAREDILLRDSIVYLTCLHELGHALGLTHTQDFRDIMYSFAYGGDVVEYFGRYRKQLRSRNDIAAVSGLSDADVNRIRAMYTRE